MEGFRRGIFSRPRNAWLALALYTAALYASLTVVFEGYLWTFQRIGPKWMSLGLNGAYFVAGVGLLIFAVARGRGDFRAYAVLVLIAVAAALCLKQEEVPANRLHLAQYGPLAILALDALRTRVSGLGLYSGVLGVVLLVGFGDESLQSLLPQRRFDPHDLWLNLVAGILALLFVAFVLGPENYPWGRRRPRRED